MFSYNEGELYNKPRSAFLVFEALLALKEGRNKKEKDICEESIRKCYKINMKKKICKIKQRIICLIGKQKSDTFILIFILFFGFLFNSRRFESSRVRLQLEMFMLFVVYFKMM